MVIFWTRLITGKISKLSYNMFLFMLKSEQINSKWIHCIQSILNNSGKYDVWLRQFTTVNLSLGKIIKQNLLDQFLQNWNAQMHASSKGRNYGLFKTDINLEKYIINLNGSLFYSMIDSVQATISCRLKLADGTIQICPKENSSSAQKMTSVTNIITSYAVPSLKKKDAPILTHIFILVQIH